MYVTPALKLLPPVDMLYVPTPPTFTEMEVGGQPAVSRYETEKVKVVTVVPDPGATRPLVRLVRCDAPEQLVA